MLVGEIAGAQHDEMPAGAEVGLQVGDGAAVAADGEVELAAVNLQRDVVAVGRRRRALGGQRKRLKAPGREEVDPERVALAADLEVREGVVDARVGHGQAGRPSAGGVLGGMQVLEAAQVAAHDDEVQPAALLDLEVAHARSRAVLDLEHQPLRPPGGQRRVASDDA